MKKTITLLLTTALIGLAMSQSLISDKQKTVLGKDTIKKSKNLFPIQEVGLDTLFFENKNFKLYKNKAHASYYADKFNGKKTASGKRFDNNKYTAAHKKFPFGTKVKVTNEVNGKFVIVEVIDRGPFVRSREIDLSKRAFKEICANKSAGVMLVTLEVLQNN
ncbi:septal ring lytic transglycosylase RlpA family protein [Flavobacterium sp.]|jgi:rare lipoprotein A|uniref:septal ring lytic transglycosylase RlpA family protein n=1 Tax=Flavobacterium sp. TaxID=239 RepID=UPI0038FBFEB1